jgi:hypothetical protein
MMEVRMWICGRFCMVFGQIEEDWSVGIPRHFSTEAIIPLSGMPFTAEELEALSDDHEMSALISDSALESVDQVAALNMPAWMREAGL